MPLQFLKASEKAGESFLVAFFVFVLEKSIGFKTQRQGRGGGWKFIASSMLILPAIRYSKSWMRGVHVTCIFLFFGTFPLIAPRHIDKIDSSRDFMSLA
jgi:hypothetical protein